MNSLKGLNTEEVNSRFADGLYNKSPGKTTKSIGAILNCTRLCRQYKKGYYGS